MPSWFKSCKAGRVVGVGIVHSSSAYKKLERGCEIFIIPRLVSCSSDGVAKHSFLIFSQDAPWQTLDWSNKGRIFYDLLRQSTHETSEFDRLVNAALEMVSRQSCSTLLIKALSTFFLIRVLSLPFVLPSVLLRHPQSSLPRFSCRCVSYWLQPRSWCCRSLSFRHLILLRSSRSDHQLVYGEEHSYPISHCRLKHFHCRLLVGRPCSDRLLQTIGNTEPLVLAFYLSNCLNECVFWYDGSSIVPLQQLVGGFGRGHNDIAGMRWAVVRHGLSNIKLLRIRVVSGVPDRNPSVAPW